MPTIKRPPRGPAPDWETLQARFTCPIQAAYELVRPVVLDGELASVRAATTGAASSTISRKAARFEAHGMFGLLPLPDPQPGPGPRDLPRNIQQAIVDLRAQHPPMRPHEIATICYVQFGRRPSPHTVQRVLAEGPPPSRTERRYPLYHEIPDPVQRRLAIIHLHAEGWNIKTIADYLGTTRPTVYATLRRWIAEDFAGLADKSHARKDGVRKVDLNAINTVRKLQENPELGEWRIHAALRQVGIRLSPRTCGRILALNRQLYGLDKPEKADPKPLPFKATRRHQYWVVDIRYIETHLLGDKPFYVISILESFSRAILASAVAWSQDLTVYLMVLYAAIRQYGTPEILVSDGGGVFRAKHAQAIYQLLNIEKKEIAPRQSWQSLIETQFNIQRRMADYHFAKAPTWEAVQEVHAKWVTDFNFQVHWAHRKRQDDRHSPAEVLGWVRGKWREPAELERIFYSVRFDRWIDRWGYIRFRQWRIYGERGLVGRQVVVWLSQERLTVEFREEPVAQYGVEYTAKHKQLREVKDGTLFTTQYRSAQRELWTREEVEWHLVRHLELIPRRKRPPVTAVQLPLWEEEATGS